MQDQSTNKVIFELEKEKPEKPADFISTNLFFIIKNKDHFQKLMEDIVLRQRCLNDPNPDIQSFVHLTPETYGPDYPTYILDISDGIVKHEDSKTIISFLQNLIVDDDMFVGKQFPNPNNIGIYPLETEYYQSAPSRWLASDYVRDFHELMSATDFDKFIGNHDKFIGNHHKEYSIYDRLIEHSTNISKKYTKALEYENKKLFKYAFCLFLDEWTNIHSCVSIGWYYYNGLGVSKNISKAMEYYAKAAKNGHILAKRWLEENS